MVIVIYLFNTNIMGKKKERGRPSEYDPKWHPEKLRWAKFLGYNNREVCKLFGIVEETYYQWLKKYPELTEAIWHGENTDRDNLTKSLTKRATGFTYREKKQVWAPASIEYRMVPDPDKPGQLKEVEIHLPKRVIEEVITEKTLPGDVGAQRFVLINLRGDRFRESAHIDHTTNGKDLDGAKMDLSLLSDEQIKTLSDLESIAMGKKPQP